MNRLVRAIALAVALLVSSGAALSIASESGQIERDSRGHIKRSHEAKKRFQEQTGYPHGRPGYVIDHIVPLACGGADDPSNMQWQSKAEAKAKDKTERKECGRSTRRTR